MNRHQQIGPTVLISQSFVDLLSCVSFQVLFPTQVLIPGSVLFEDSRPTTRYSGSFTDVRAALALWYLLGNWNETSQSLDSASDGILLI